MEWMRLAIEFITVLLVNGCFFYSITRKLKQVEVNEKEVEVIKKLDDEWQELYREAKERIRSIGEICQQLRTENEELKKTNGKLELAVLKLSWYRCNVNNCPNRRPPHVFDIDGVELEDKANKRLE